MDEEEIGRKLTPWTGARAGSPRTRRGSAPPLPPIQLLPLSWFPPVVHFSSPSVYELSYSLQVAPPVP